MLRLSSGHTNRWSLGALALLSFVTATHAADVEAGKAKVAQLCADCHRPKDWSGETPAALESLIKDIVAAKITHPQRKLNLTTQEIKDIAAYWTSGRK